MGGAIGGIGGAIGGIGGAIGGILGAPTGGIVQGTLGPAIDEAAAKFTAVADHAADRIDQSLKTENIALDQIAQQNIARIDVVMKTRIDQVDKLIDDKLQRIQLIADDTLNREASLIDNALNKESSIINNALTRIDTISDRSINRIQGIETDAMNRIDSALQDQVPLAASRVANEIVAAALVIVFLVVLVGFGGVSLLRKLQRAGNQSASSVSQTLRVGLKSFWRELPQEAVTVVLPMIFISAAIIGGYEAYRYSVKHLRVSRLAKAASLLEAAGEYRLAAELRRRVVSVDESSDTAGKAYKLKADLWLASFSEAHVRDVNTLMRQLLALEEDGGSSSNGDLIAASLYLSAQLGNQIDPDGIQRYRERFLAGKQSSQVPFLGKLVLITQIKRDLDQPGSIKNRLDKALTELRELERLYPNYANAKVLAGMLLGSQADIASRGPAPAPAPNSESKLREGVQTTLARAATLDPELVQVVRLANFVLPPDILKDLDESPQNADLPKRLAVFANANAMPLARSVLVSEVLSQTAVDRALLHAIRRGVGERRADKLIASARASGQKPEDRLSTLVNLSESLFSIGSFALAEEWTAVARGSVSAVKPPDPAMIDRITTLETSLQNAKLSAGFTEVI